MTNQWTDIANSDRILVIAGNPAENHPAAYGHITKAQEKGAKLIVVDPRFTRSASKANIYCPLRSGTDVAFIGGIIKYVIDDMLATDWANYNKTYLVEYTNASYLVDEKYQGPDELNGLFSGYNSEKRSYVKDTWKFQVDDKGIPKRDKTLQDRNCVFQILKRHFARYTPDMVNKITGAPKDKSLEVAKTYAQSGAVGKSGTLMYAMGATHHTNGTQIIRSYCILQLLLANIGVAGGGIQAMRGESNVQGSTDMGLLHHILTGYNPAPVHTDETLEKYLTRVTPPKYSDPLSANFLQNTDKWVISMLKAWWGDAATKDSEFAFHYLPMGQSGKNYTHIAIFEAMEKGEIKGLMCWGQNPAVGGPNANQERKALAKLDWLVCTDLWETETSIFWKRPVVDAGSIDTEVFLLPAAASYEKEGSVTNSARWMQWRYKGADAPGDAKPDLDMINDLMLRIKELYATDTSAPKRDIILNLTWDYKSDTDPKEADPTKVAKEVNGKDLITNKLINGFANLKIDGTTSCGNWVFCGSYVEQESLDAFEKQHPEMFYGYPDPKYIGNRATRRYPKDVGNLGLIAGDKSIGIYSYWSWCWPMNRRIVYNRASVDPAGVPWDKEHAVITWKDGAWTGDVPDGGAKPMAEGGTYPFIMKSTGHSYLFANNVNTREASLADGPLPEHYEPWESPLDANPLSAQKNDPVIKIWRPNEQSTPDKYPIVATTYRVVEHWQAGQMTRNLPWLVETMPEMFVEMSMELAAELGIANGEKVIIENERTLESGGVKAVALVTLRFKPFILNGKTVHQVGMPWHWGYAGLSKGDSANVLTPSVGDANTSCPEYKAFLCRIRKA